MKIGNAFDVTNACNSFLQAINVGNSMIATGAAHRVLIVSGEIGSYVCNRQINHVDELSYKMGGLTLGDAGAAMILEPAEGNIGIQEINLLSLGQHWEMCHVPETTDWRQKPDGTIHGWFYLDMPELAKVAKRESVNYFKEYKTMRRELYGEAMMLDSLAHLVPHQISRKFIEDICSALDFDASMIPITADILGNTASTSIPLVLHGLMEQSKLDFDSGQEVFLYGAASGFGIGHIRVKF
ncbi:MAG: hypothetical protein C0616_11585 [Desulfuromonas sp.]|nr:MAG: hypothetical protein C0616_11585 [Desulfuromonas sp.]